MGTEERGLAPVAGATATHGPMGEVGIARTGDVGSTALAARATAEVQARYVMAMQRPRDVDVFRTRLLRDCQRRGFAEVARYARPVGKEKNERTGEWEEKIARGPSIRFIEAALRAYGNVHVQTTVVHEDDDARSLVVTAVDLETNFSVEVPVVVPKKIERRHPGEREIISARTNSQKKTTYTVRATDDELLVKQAALVSKAFRNAGQRLLPGDVVEEGQEMCVRTVEAAAAADPDAERKRIVDGFVALGVAPDALAEYLGHPVAQCVPAEISDLRIVYATLRDGEARWADVLEAKRGPATVAADPGATATNAKADAVREKLAARKGGAKPAAAATTTTTTPAATDPAAAPAKAKPEREPGEDDAVNADEVGAEGFEKWQAAKAAKESAEGKGGGGAS